MTKPALHVDHIIPRAVGGTDELENLQSLCTNCHSRKTAEETGWHKRQGQRGRVTIIAGPPGSGKSSYVQDAAKYGDLRLDLDTLYQALSGLPAREKPQAILPFARAAYDGVVRALTKANDLRMAWVIGTLANQSDRARLAGLLGAQTIVLEVPAEECLRRIGADERRRDKVEQWRPIVESWWRQYRRGEGEIVLGGAESEARETS